MSNQGGFSIPAEFAADVLKAFREHPPRILDDTVFMPHQEGCPPCRCARHCHCFRWYYEDER